MVRQLRIEYPGAVYHVTSRGNARKDIYLDEDDRHHYLALLAEVCTRFNWKCYGYCLMSNHYHLVIETVEANLSKGMQQLNSVYSQRFNQSHRRVGHVFQGRYKAIVVEKERYLLELVRYVILNPVRANMVKTAGQWKWSSYRSMMGKHASPHWLARDWLLSQFGSRLSLAQSRFVDFISQGRIDDDIWENLRKQIYLGDESFVERMASLAEKQNDLTEYVSAHRCRTVKPIAWYVTQASYRSEAIHLAFESGGYSQKALADYFGLHYSSVSKIIKSVKTRDASNHKS
jgi:putative transposase